MSLLSAIRLAANTLHANQIGMQVVGQNIANVNTPGYIREETVLVPAPAQNIGRLQIGTGVDIQGVVQQVDAFLEGRLRASVSERAEADVQTEIYTQLETIIGEMGDNDLSTQLTNFFSRIDDVLNQPESVAVRNLVVQQGIALTYEINHLAESVDDLRASINGQVLTMAGDVNSLIERIRELNLKITISEGGEESTSDAVGLRDQRMQALEDLATMIDITAKEQTDGSVAVYSGGDYLVFQGSAREIEATIESDRGLGVAALNVVGVDTTLQPASGQLAGLFSARDDILGDFHDRLDDLARVLAFEFNKIHSSGQGLTGYQDLTSEFGVDDADLNLDEAGLEFTPGHGSFQVIVHDTSTGITKTTDVRVDLNGGDDDVTLNELATSLSAIAGITATVTSVGKLRIASDSAAQEFTFANDTSGALAALGLNTFFSGSSATDIGVSAVLRSDPSKFAASRNGIGVDTENAVELAAFGDRPITSEGGATITGIYESLIGDTTVSAAVANSVADAARGFEGTLRSQKLAISGVNLDDEAVRMIALQRAFQATARYIAALNSLLETLVAL